ncbi:MAG: hypothetical protein ACOVN5_04610, partial [Aquidulcibacter sp.]
PDLECNVVAARVGQPPIVPVIYPGTTSFREAEEVLGELERYSSSLARITDAGDNKELEGAATSFCSSATALGAIVSAVPAAIIGPACGLSSVALVSWLNHRRYEVLRTAVEQADSSLMPKAQTYLGEKLVQVTGQRLTARSQNLDRDLRTANESTGRDPVRRDVDEQAIRRVIDNVAAIRILLRADAAEPARKMAEAHRALREALSDRNRQTEEVGQAVLSFLTAVGKLRDAIKEAGA